MANYRTTAHDSGEDGFPSMEASRWGGSYNSRDGFQLTQGDLRNGSVDMGSPYEEVPVAEEPSSSGWSFTSLMGASSLFGWANRSNAETQARGSSSAGGTRRAGNQSSYYGGQKSDYFEQPSRVFESKDVNGNYSRSLGDLPRVPVPKEASANDLKVSHWETTRLVKHNEELEKDLSATLKKFHLEKIRADASEKEISKYKGEMQGFYREKVRADAVEKENREIQARLEMLSREKERADAVEKANRELQGKLETLSREKVRVDAVEKVNRELQGKLETLSREKVRADAVEKVNREVQEKLETLSQEKVRADNLERENREFEAKLKKEEQEVRELQSKLQHVLETKELEVAELKKLQNDIGRENQELNSWKLEQERKVVLDTSTAGQFRTKVADLTYAKGQLEKKEQQLTNQVQDQTKRIAGLKQHNSVLVVKIGALEAQVQSLLDRLHDERKKLQQRNTEIEELKKKLKPQVTTADKEAQGDDQEARERALKAQCTALEQQVRSKESETQSLSLTISKLNERLRQCDLEIDDLKQEILDRESRDSHEFEAAPPKEYIGGESFLESEATPYLFDRAVQRVHEGAGIFARLLMKAMEQGKIDGMAVARNNFVRSISLGKAAPLKYVLEAITCKLLFHSFEHECFDLQESTSGFLDMEQQRTDNFREYKYLNSIDCPEQLVLTEDSLFTHFCRIKLESLSAAVPEIEGMVQEIVSRTFDRSASSEDTSTDIATYLASKLGTTFVKLALCVWQVHKLAFAFHPAARIFRVSQSEKFVEKYMESVIFQESESEDEDMSRVDISRVDFMVVPGFFINRIVIRSRVFVVTKPLSSAFEIRGEPQPAST